jgi:hypothetical protein
VFGSAERFEDSAIVWPKPKGAGLDSYTILRRPCQTSCVRTGPPIGGPNYPQNVS